MGLLPERRPVRGSWHPRPHDPADPNMVYMDRRGVRMVS